MQKIPVYIVTGFLESGKTSFLQDIVTDSEFTLWAEVQVAFYWNDHLVAFVEKTFEPGDDLETAYEVYESYDRYEVFASAF